MIGKQHPQHELFDVGNVFPLALRAGSFHGQLAVAAPKLFRDEDFAVFYSERTGRPSVPPSQLALMTLMQHESGCSDAEAVARTAYDLRWAAVLRRPAGEPLCAKSTFQLFRAHLVLHDEARAIFEKSIQEARRAGLLKGGALKIAVDTKPILGRGAVEDTYNLLGTGIQGLVRALAGLEQSKPEDWATCHDFGRYLGSNGPSLKGSADIDWSDPEARKQFLTEIVTDARRLLRLAGEALAGVSPEKAASVREAAALLEQLLLQDVVETTGADGEGRASIKEGTAPGRIPSAKDPEMRHGRKSKSKRFDGHKASIAVEVESQIIVDADVIAGDAPDAEGLLAQVERVEEQTGQRVEQTLGDCAYGSGAIRQTFAAAERTLVAKVPQEPTNNGFFPKSAFVLDLVNDTVTCPGGQTTGKFTGSEANGKLFHFGALCQGCSMRAQCTPAVGGRQVRVHPQEALLQAAREQQQTPEGRARLQQRGVVEHRLARLAQLRINQARYIGRKKTRFQLLIAATIANLRRTWNWEAARPEAGEPAAGTYAQGPPKVDRGGQRGSGSASAGSTAGPGWQGPEALRCRLLAHRLSLRAPLLTRPGSPAPAFRLAWASAGCLSNTAFRPRF